jgi:hypothetical protein
MKQEYYPIDHDIVHFDDVFAKHGAKGGIPVCQDVTQATAGSSRCLPMSCHVPATGIKSQGK